MNIVILDALTLGNTSLKGIEKLGKLTIYQTTSNNNIIKRAKDADVILVNKVVLDSSILKNLPNLKLICITATGMNNIDLEVAKSLNIEVKNVANYSTQAVTQHTFMLVLSMLGKLRYYDKYTMKGKWCKSNIFCHLDSAFEIYELQGKNWGIIGLGTIGKQVASVAKAFGANVCYYSTSGKNNSSEFKQENSLQALLKNCDIISIHAPLNENTKNLITKKELKMLKNDAILVNVGRGGIVNEKDLVKVLKERNFYFATDVLETEPMLKDHPLLDKKIKDKVLITPHYAWAYKETRERLIKGVEENIKNFINKKSHMESI